MSKKKKLIIFVSSTWTFLLSWLVSKCTVLTGSSGTSCDSSMAVGEGVFTVRPGKSVPSVSAASALAKALLERHKSTRWDIFIYAPPAPASPPRWGWSLSGVCMYCRGAEHYGKVKRKLGLTGPNPTVTLVAGELSPAGEAREAPHKSTRCFLRTLPLSSTHAWIIWPRLLTCILTYIWWKQGSLYSFLIVSKALGVSAQAVTFKGWVRIRSNLILFTPCFL